MTVIGRLVRNMNSKSKTAFSQEQQNQKEQVRNINIKSETGTSCTMYMSGIGTQVRNWISKPETDPMARNSKSGTG